MRKHTKRKVWALVNPIEHAIEGTRPPTGEKLDQLRMHELTSIEAFRTGKATKHDWAKVVGMLNLTEEMTRRGIGQEAIPTLEEAQSHLLEAARRFEKTRKMGITGPGLQAIRDLYEYHDLMRQSIPLVQYEAVIRSTNNRINSLAPEVCNALEHM